MKKIILLFALMSLALTIQAQIENQDVSLSVSRDINLPQPVKTGGKPFFETVNERHSERSYVKKEMPLQTLSNLLWVANGFNRSGARRLLS